MATAKKKTRKKGGKLPRYNEGHRLSLGQVYAKDELREVQIWKTDKGVMLEIECQAHTTDQWRKKGRALILRNCYMDSLQLEDSTFDDLTSAVLDGEDLTVARLREFSKKLREELDSDDLGGVDEDYRLLCLLCDFAEKACAD